MKNRRIFFISDPHFDHPNIILYCKRPFIKEGYLNEKGKFKTNEMAQQCVKEMNETIIKRYNYLVQPNDIVYFLGDIGFRNAFSCRQIINQLNGIKILVLGNHDRWGIFSYYNMGFSAVVQEAEIRVGKDWVTLAHYPRRWPWEIAKILWLYIRKMRKRKRPWSQIIQKLKKEWKWTKFPRRKQWHICGHVHEKWKIKGRNINISVDQWNFSPVRFEEIVKIIKEEKYE